MRWISIADHRSVRINLQLVHHLFPVCYLFYHETPEKSFPVFLNSLLFRAAPTDKLVEYRNISKWLKISPPFIWKKKLHQSHIEKEGKMPEKTFYSLANPGEREFEKLMLKIAAKSLHIYPDFNAVILNIAINPSHIRSAYRAPGIPER